MRASPAGSRAAGPSGRAALLEDSELTVSEVAHTVGFGSTEAMRRHFVAQTGTTPRSYRETFRGSLVAPAVAAKWVRAEARAA